MVKTWTFPQDSPLFGGLYFFFPKFFRKLLSFLYVDRLKDLNYYIFLKCSFCFTYINIIIVGLLIASDSVWVYNIFSLTVYVYWSKLFLHAVACLLVWIWSILMKIFFNVTVDDWFYFFCAAVANFYCVFIKYFV